MKQHNCFIKTIVSKRLFGFLHNKSAYSLFLIPKNSSHHEDPCQQFMVGYIVWELQEIREKETNYYLDELEMEIGWNDFDVNNQIVDDMVNCE